MAQHKIRLWKCLCGPKCGKGWGSAEGRSHPSEGNGLRERFHLEKALCPCMSSLVWGCLEEPSSPHLGLWGDRCYRKAAGNSEEVLRS